MRRNGRCRIWICGMFFALALVLGVAAGCVHKQAYGMQRHSSCYLQEGISAEEAKQILNASEKAAEGMEGQELSGGDVCIWGESKGQQLRALQTGTAAQADVVQLYGSSEWLFPGSAILQKGDWEGCLIGADTARELFGSPGVIGEKVRWNDSVWTIRGIVQEPGHFLAVAGSCDEDAASLNRVTAGCETNGQDCGRVETFAMVYGLSAQSLRWDYLYDVRWLKELIPGKWSDFEGWSARWSEKRQDLQRMFEIEKSSVEVWYLSTCIKSVCLGIASLLCFLMALRMAIRYEKSIYNAFPLLYNRNT